MKKALLMLSSVILMTGLSFSQKVDSIKVEQSGDFIKIRYNIVNSTIYQVYDIKVLCSMNGGMKTELRSITGDIGEGILGGKKEYVVLWDVFKDVDELRSVEFFVRAQLIKDNTKINLPTDERLLKRKIYIIAAGMIDGENGHFGVRFAYMSSWGVSAKLLIGKRGTGQLNKTFFSPATGLDLTKRIIKNPEYQFHLLAGISTIKLQQFEPLSDQKTFLTGEIGFIFARKRILLGAAFSAVKENKVQTQNTFGEIGLGIKF
jgi:hypothetical protein